MNMLSISALLSAVIRPSAQSFSKSVFNRLTSVLTEILSKLAMYKLMILLDNEIISSVFLTSWECAEPTKWQVLMFGRHKGVIIVNNTVVAGLFAEFFAAQRK
jgi:hypothetical protein